MRVNREPGKRGQGWPYPAKMPDGFTGGSYGTQKEPQGADLLF